MTAAADAPPIARGITDCARCGTRRYGLTPPACVFCGAVFSVATKEKR